MTEYVVLNASDCFTLLRRGEKNRYTRRVIKYRITRQTKANINSSRSHSIFQLLVETDKADGRGMFIVNRHHNE